MKEIIKPKMMRTNENMESDVIYVRTSKKDFKPVPFSKEQFLINKYKGKLNSGEFLFVVPWQQIG